MQVLGSGCSRESRLIADPPHEPERGLNTRLDAYPAEQLCRTPRDVGDDVGTAGASTIGTRRDRHERDRRIDFECENGRCQQMGQRPLHGESATLLPRDQRGSQHPVVVSRRRDQAGLLSNDPRLGPHRQRAIARRVPARRSRRRRTSLPPPRGPHRRTIPCSKIRPGRGHVGQRAPRRCGQPQANIGFKTGRKSPSSGPANGRRGSVRTNSVPSPTRL